MSFSGMLEDMFRTAVYVAGPKALSRQIGFCWMMFKQQRLTSQLPPKSPQFPADL